MMWHLTMLLLGVLIWGNKAQDGWDSCIQRSVYVTTTHISCSPHYAFYYVVACVPFSYPTHIYIHVCASSVLSSGKYLALPGTQTTVVLVTYPLVICWTGVQIPVTVYSSSLKTEPWFFLTWPHAWLKIGYSKTGTNSKTMWERYFCVWSQ